MPSAALVTSRPSRSPRAATAARAPSTSSSRSPASRAPRRMRPSTGLGVGRRRLGAAAAVADGSRVGARALRPDPQQPAGVDAGERAAAGADRVEVDHRDHHLVAAEVRVVQVLHPHDGVRRDADVRRRPAHVERDDAAVAGGPRGGDAADDPRDRAGHQQLRRARHRAVDRQRAAVGCHEVEVRVRRDVAQRRVHVAQVAAGLRADVRVERRGREPLVLAVLRDDLVADRQVDPGELLLEDLLDAPLVLGVEEREQEADGDRLDLRLAQRRGGVAHLPLVEGHLDVARRDDALGDDVAVAARDQRRLAPREVLVDRERLRPPVAPDVDDVPEPAGRDHPGRRAVALEDDVRRDGRPVQQLPDVGGDHAAELAELAQADHRRLRRVARGARDLVHDHRARLVVDEHEVGERAPDVDPDPQH